MALERVPTLLAAILLLQQPSGSEAQTARVDAQLLGLEGELRENALAVTSIVAAARAGELPASRIRQLHQKAPDEIALALQPFGYYRPTIEDELVDTGRTWLARYRVHPGPPLLLQRLDVRVDGGGERDSVILRAVAAFPLAEGDTLRHQSYEIGKAALVAIAAERGYLDAAFDTSEIRIDTIAYTAQIVLHMSSGPRYRFGTVSFNQEILDPRLFEGYVRFEPGDSFELSKLRSLQSDLTATPYWGQVEVKPRVDLAEEARVPIEVDLVARRPRSYEIGFGFGTDTGFRGSLEARWRRVNRKGHTASLRLDASQIERRITASYRFPPRFPRTATYTIIAGFGDFSPTWSNSVTASLGVNRSQARRSWLEVLSVSYEITSFTIGSQQDDSYLLIPGVNWTRIRTDDVILTRHGSRIDFLVSGSLDALFSNATHLQLVGEGKIVRSLIPRTRVIGRATLGKTFTSQFEKLPPSIRFVTGGDQTVRGYAFESLGPRDVDGSLVGGDLLVIANLEADYELIKKWRLAAFVDSGNALESLSDLSVEFGAGVGVRWESPVGLVRFDLAYPVSQPERNGRIHFTFGPDI